MSAADHVGAAGVVPVASAPDVESAVQLCAALVGAALPVVEITFRTPAAADAIAAVVQRFPDMLVGAGTVLSREDVRAARDAGAAFAVAPGFNPSVAQAARDADLPFVPGVSTPSEIEAALAAGCTILKLFPAEPLGGVPYLRAVAAPYAHKGVRFIPTGGIDGRSLAGYLAVPSVLAVGGTWIASSDAVNGAKWPVIAERAREAVETVRSIRDPQVHA